MLTHEKIRAYKEAYLASVNGYLANRWAKESSVAMTAIFAHKTADAVAKEYIAAIEAMQKEGSSI